MTLRLRWQRSSASWRLRRANRKLERERRRETLLLLSLDSSRLRLKELEQVQATAEHRLAEMLGSLQYRTTGTLPLQESIRTEPQYLDQALGLSTPPR